MNDSPAKWISRARELVINTGAGTACY